MEFELLIDELPVRLVRAGSTPISSIVDDSRRAAAGCLFIARPGAGGDALAYVASAVRAGAAAVLLPEVDDDTLERLSLPESVGLAIAEPGTAVDQRLAGRLAERFHDDPSSKLKLIGVTGTNGKTTTVTITKHLLESAGHKCGLIGTVELDTGAPEGPRPATLTTPGAIELSALLAEMVANGCAYGVMEVSSHALDQGRADHLRFSAAAFTNLTQDHLDYHGTMAAYADAKATLFESLDEDAVAVINTDDPASARMVRGCRAEVKRAVVRDHPMSAGRLQLDAEYAALVMELTSAQSKAVLASGKGVTPTSFPMPGRHNLANAILAVGLVSELTGLSPAEQQQAIERCLPVPGRLEPVGPDWPDPSTHEGLPAVLVDYAHTPDALINVGKAMHALTQGKLITVFGCGGDRDRAKRPLMAKAAQQYAHIIVLTSDNPRTEDPQQILDDAEAGLMKTPDTHTVADRAEAIRFAIQLAGADDTVLIAGKGHEDYQIVGTTKHHFDDREQAAAALREKAGAA
ncbi:MAG: UDP-N-acetylmuramoyl-L-alanyl-D-glutamate--2,6-diaminopimelate ligase [Planctomycetota bacterium]